MTKTVISERKVVLKLVFKMHTVRLNKVGYSRLGGVELYIFLIKFSL